MAGALGIYGSTMFTALGLNHPSLLVLRVSTLTTAVTTKILEFAALVRSTVIIFYCYEYILMQVETQPHVLTMMFACGMPMDKLIRA